MLNLSASFSKKSIIKKISLDTPLITRTALDNQLVTRTALDTSLIKALQIPKISKPKYTRVLKHPPILSRAKIAVTRTEKGMGLKLPPAATPRKPSNAIVFDHLQKPTVCSTQRLLGFKTRTSQRPSHVDST
jgi:hypothetical protein